MQDKKNLDLLLSSHFPILVIETHEETRAVDLLKSVVRDNGKSLHTWSAARGLQNSLVGDTHELQLADGEVPSPGDDVIS